MISDVAAPAQTFAEIVVDDIVRDSISAALREFPDPVDDIDRSLACLRMIFAQLPVDQAQTILDFGRHVDTPGVALVRNLPVDPSLPDTPVDGEPSRTKKTFVAETVLLGLSQMLGEPVGFTTEKSGRLIHDVVPVSAGATSQTNQSSHVFLNFHNDIVHDSVGRYDVSNPDFLVLNCVRQDRNKEAVTHYADARDITRELDPSVVETLRSPLFRLNAPGSYIRDVAGGGEVLSDPVAVISGPVDCPEIAISANGVRGLDDVATEALAQLQAACRAVAHQVKLEPGTALLINNRKGLHARSQFFAQHDGQDRWLQRTYIRRSLWTIRYRGTGFDRRVH
ncbi:L-asparagine oxygenase [Kibdelosporangium banguiense]|uniref:L-asparagine oxygenase n=1 Tax=Kibdelosporangium banguiense TaxID=1365924 RepID=A0ABS4TPR2_9PSEU|nr:TauD/TfdA family dioxygenase [Kibdelosporangium banguiense]MBP2326391.1 L-asparagine oxygenase [Kibdelosporangium banguiense]